MKKVVIMRGPSGCGKSTKVSQLQENSSDCVVVSSDFFFEDINEEGLRVYNFDQSELGKAHSFCLSCFICAVYENHELIVVDNTNIHLWEYENYIKIAEKNGYKIEIYEAYVEKIEDIKACVSRSQHNVPPEVIVRMCIEFEKDVKNANNTVFFEID